MKKIYKHHSIHRLLLAQLMDGLVFVDFRVRTFFTLGVLIYIYVYIQ